MNFDLNKVYNLLTEKVEEWLSTAIKMLPNLLVAMLVFALFVFLAKIVRKLFSRVMDRFTDNKSIQNLLSSIIYIGIIALGTFITLSILNLDGAVTSLLAGAGVIGLALGFAFQDIASNFIAGTMMGIRRPFKVGDLIETNDFFGQVLKINLRTTKIETMQGQQILIPNAEVFKNPITNYSEKGKRRVDIAVGVTYGQDLPFAKKIAKEAIEKIEEVKAEEVSIFYTGFGASSIDFVIRYWIKFSNKQFEYLTKKDEGIIAIKQAFDKNDIGIPFPIRTLDFGDVDFKSIFSQAQSSLGQTASSNSGSNSTPAK
jgi:small conductance mechanosensitive channel